MKHPVCDPRLTSFFRSAFVMLLGSTALPAADFSAFAGEWSSASLITPTRLRKTYFDVVGGTYRTTASSTETANPMEALVDAFYSSPVFSESKTFTVSVEGSASGGESGQILGIVQNRISYYNPDDPAPLTLYSSSTRDVMLQNSVTADQQELILYLKKPTSLSTAELAGTWRVAYLSHPDNLSTFIRPDDPESTDIETRLLDTWFVDIPSIVSGTITIDPSGAFAGAFSGNITANSGTRTATAVTANGPAVFNVNAAKDVLVATIGEAEGTSDRQMIILTRKPETLTTADLEGSWRLCVIRLPHTLTETFQNLETKALRQAANEETAGVGESLVDVFHQEEFSIERFNASGTSLAASGLAVTVANAGNPVTLYPNAGKTCMVGVQTDATTNDLIVAVRTSPILIEETLDQIVSLRIVHTENGGTVYWNGASNLKLQAGNGLGTWADVTGTANADSYTFGSGEGPFFRVALIP